MPRRHTYSIKKNCINVNATLISYNPMDDNKLISSSHIVVQRGNI